MNIENSKILVIGGAGFIGSFVVSELLKENISEVVVYDNFARGNKDYLTEQLKDARCSVFPIGGDVRDLDILDAAVKGKDYVICLAAMWLLHCKDYPRTAFEVNIAGTFNILEACVRNGVKKLVWSSSASVYGDAVELPMTEKHPFNNKNFYGATKIAGEAMCTAFNDRYGLPIVGLRYMNVYGPRQDYRGAYIAVIMKMLDNLDKGIAPILYGDGSQAYDFVYVGDCAKANVCAMKADTIDEFYNVGTGIRTSIKELAEMILKITGSDLAVQYEPAGLTFVKNRIGCPKKAQEQIGFKSSISLEAGLKQLIEWRKNHIDEVNMKRSKVV